MSSIKPLLSSVNRKRFSVIHLSVAIVALGLLFSLALYIRSNEKPSPVVAANYSDCVQKGGQVLSYDGAIQFDACLSGNNQLSLQYSAQNMPRIDEHKITSTPNHIVYSASDPADLVSFLQRDDTGCASMQSVGYYKIMKVVPDQFAEMTFGCDSYTQQQKDSAHIIAMKLGDGWALLSPTNNFNEQGVPSCLLVDMFRISKSLSSQCYQNTGYGDGSLRQVTYL